MSQDTGLSVQGKENPTPRLRQERCCRKIKKYPSSCLNDVGENCRLQAVLGLALILVLRDLQIHGATSAFF